MQTKTINSMPKMYKNQFNKHFEWIVIQCTSAKLDEKSDGFEQCYSMQWFFFLSFLFFIFFRSCIERTILIHLCTHINLVIKMDETWINEFLKICQRSSDDKMHFVYYHRQMYGRRTNPLYLDKFPFFFADLPSDKLHLHFWVRW